MTKNLDQKLAKHSFVKVIQTGTILEVFQYERPYFYNMASRSKKSLGEICDTKRKDSILRAQAQVRRLVNSNAFVWGYMPIFVTYTFRENLQDIVLANSLFTAHMRAMKKKHFGHLRYLAVPEFQKRGAVHFHVVFFDLPYMEGIKQIFESNWTHGFIQVKAIRHVRNVGAYISKYFSKGWAMQRKKGSKAFFTSFGLHQPVVYYSLDKFENLSTMNLECDSVYETEKYGRVSYKQYRVN